MAGLPEPGPEEAGMEDEPFRQYEPEPEPLDVWEMILGGPPRGRAEAPDRSDPKGAREGPVQPSA